MTSVAEITRASGIGASEIAAVCGLSPFDEPWDIYARKLGLIPPKEQTERMYWGTKLEPVIASVFMEKTEIPVEWWNKRIQSNRYPWQFATPDAFLLSKDRIDRVGILECKTAGLDQAGEWGKVGGEIGDEDGAPEYYIPQVEWQMSTCELYIGYLAVLIAGNDFRIYRINHDPVLEKNLLEEGEDFWRMHVMSRVAPPISGSDLARDYLQRKFPRHIENLRPPTADETGLLEQYAELRHLLDQGAERRKTLENQITESIGHAEGLDWEKGKFTWKRTKDIEKTEWKKMGQDQLAACEPAERTELLKRYTHVAEGYRRILFRGKE